MYGTFGSFISQEAAVGLSSQNTKDPWIPGFSRISKLWDLSGKGTPSPGLTRQAGMGGRRWRVKQ